LITGEENGKEMNITKQLSELLQYYTMTRGIGHTTLLKEGTNNYLSPKFVLANKKEFATELDCKPQEVISLLNLDALQGHNRPMVIDNGAMIELLSESLMRIEALEEENKKLLKRNQLILVTPGDKLWKKVDKLQKELDNLREQGKTVLIGKNRR
jgi:hypothetical protein